NQQQRPPAHIPVPDGVPVQLPYFHQQRQHANGQQDERSNNRRPPSAPPIRPPVMALRPGLIPLRPRVIPRLPASLPRVRRRILPRRIRWLRSHNLLSASLFPIHSSRSIPPRTPFLGGIRRRLGGILRRARI